MTGQGDGGYQFLENHKYTDIADIVDMVFSITCKFIFTSDMLYEVVRNEADYARRRNTDGLLVLNDCEFTVDGPSTSDECGRIFRRTIDECDTSSTQWKKGGKVTSNCAVYDFDPGLSVGLFD